MLITSQIKEGRHFYEVQKEGLIFLRTLANKRLRIIFNVSPSTSTSNMESFNSHFLSKVPAQDNQATSIAPYTSMLSISSTTKQLQNNRVIIFLNAYYSEPIDNARVPHLLVAGYLVASVFLYHHEGVFGEHDHFTHLMGRLGSLLKGTDVVKLEQEIKYATGFAKKPYLMCICKTKQSEDIESNYHELFRQAYKYKEGHGVLNEAVDTLIDYFPERTAIFVGDDHKSGEYCKRVEKIGVSYRQEILGRRIFNFELTAATLENLCFELCQQFNKNADIQENGRHVNLLDIYNKIIVSQKSQLLSIIIQKYQKVVKQLTATLPIHESQLLQSYYQIQKYIIHETIQYASNCMNFEQFMQTYNSILPIFSKTFTTLLPNNKELKRNLSLQAYHALQDQLSSANHSTLQECMQYLDIHSHAISIFMQSTVEDTSTQNLLCRMIKKFSGQVCQALGQIDDAHLREIKQQRDKIAQLQLDNRVLEIRCKEFENQFIYLNAINDEYKQKLLAGTTFSSPAVAGDRESELVLELKRKIMELQIQIAEKNSVIGSMGQILDKLDVQFNRKYYKPRLSKHTQNFLAELTQKCHNLYALFTELKKTQQIYSSIVSEFQSKKQSIYADLESEKRTMQDNREKLAMLAKERTFMEEIIIESKRSIEVLERVKEEQKLALDQMESIGSRGKCMLAEMEGIFEKWKKALELVVVMVLSGKSEKLRDFYKVCGEAELCAALKPIFKK